MKSKLIIIIFISIIMGLIGGVGTYAYFNAQVVSTDNIYELGTLQIDKVSEIPQPLFFSKPRKAYVDLNTEDPWAIGYWYPGLVIEGQDRSLTIENTGTLPARVFGISAVMSDFKNPSNNKNAQSEFTENMIITVRSRVGNLIYYKGTLKKLLEAVQPLKNNNDSIKLYPKKPTYPQDLYRVDLNFEAMMSTEADNDVQGVSAKVDLLIHATQDNNKSVNFFLNN